MASKRTRLAIGLLCVLAWAVPAQAVIAHVADVKGAATGGANYTFTANFSGANSWCVPW